jgi:hypothetical protein
MSVFSSSATPTLQAVCFPQVFSKQGWRWAQKRRQAFMSNTSYLWMVLTRVEIVCWNTLLVKLVKICVAFLEFLHKDRRTSRIQKRTCAAVIPNGPKVWIVDKVQGIEAKAPVHREGWDTWNWNRLFVFQKTSRTGKKNALPAVKCVCVCVARGCRRLQCVVQCWCVTCHCVVKVSGFR